MKRVLAYAINYRCCKIEATTRLGNRKQETSDEGIVSGTAIQGQ